MRDFGPHKKFDCKLDKGLNLLIGKNGAGKSNTVKAIGWALLGPGALPSDVKQDDIIHDEAEQAKVIVDIDINDELHRFRRTYNGKQVSASVSIVDEKGNETRIAETPTGVAAYLAQSGFDLESFKVLVSMQEDLTRILKERPAERVKLFDRLMNTSDVNSAIGEASELGSVKLERPVEEDVTGMIDRRADNGFKMNSLGTQIVSWGEQCIVLEDDIKDMRDVLSQFSETSEKLSVAQSNAMVINNEISRKTSEINQLRAEGEMFKSDIEDSGKAEEDLKKLKNEHAEIESSLQKSKDLVDELVSSISREDGEIHALKLFRDSIKNEGVCLACGSENPDENKLDENISVKETLVSDLKLKHKNSKDQFKKLSINLDDSLNKIIDLQQSIENLAKSKACNFRANEISLIVGRIKNKYEEVKNEIKEISSKLPDSEFMKELEEKESELLILQDKISKAKNLKHSMDQENVEIDRKLGKYHEAVKIYNEDMQVRSEWSGTAKELKRFKNYLIIEALTWVSDRSTQILQRIDSLPDIQPNSKIVIDPKLEFWIRTDGVQKPVRRFSGGQKAAFSVCLRIALAEFFSSRLGLNGMLILDAAFESMDNDNRESTAVALESTGQKQAIICMYEDVPSLEATRIVIGD